jgi:hypothetical protein
MDRQSEGNAAVTWSRTTIEDFLRAHLEAGSVLDVDVIAKIYNDPFMFAGPDGARAVPVQPFLAALPQRRAFFDAVGQGATELVSFEETRIDQRYVLVRAKLKMIFQQGNAVPVDVLLDTTYLLFDDGAAPRIVLQLESEDISQVLRDRGILPAES